MRLDLYQAEAARVATEQGALQKLIENAIGKAKQLLKAGDQPVPVYPYDTFNALASRDLVALAGLPAWNAIIVLRSRIV